MNPTIMAVPGIRAGHAHDVEARTGCTVILGPFRAAAHVPGFATGTRELHAIRPTSLVERVDAVLLTGGSAFGLAAADGVVAWLEEHGAGFETGVARVPVVPAAVLYDLAEGRADVRPDVAMGRDACERAGTEPLAEGAIGAGAGATVGKLLGREGASPGGIGTFAAKFGAWTIGAVVAVNAFGDVVDATGRIVAGARDSSGRFIDTMQVLASGAAAPDFSQTHTNTTLALIATDAPLTRTALQTLAQAATAAFGARIRPVFSPFDGDVVFAVSTAEETRPVSPPELLALSVSAQQVLAEAILRAVRRR